MNLNDLSSEIIGTAIEIHKALGSGLLENAYHRCLEHELKRKNINCKSEFTLPIKYKELTIETGYRIDLLVEDRIVVELKSVEKITDMHKAQILTYLKMGSYELGLILNFKEPLLKNGIYRFINSAASALTSVNSV